MTAPSPTLPFNLTSRDHQAIASYERACAEAGQVPTDQGRAEWVREWRDLDEDDRLEAIEAERWRAGLEP